MSSVNHTEDQVVSQALRKVRVEKKKSKLPKISESQLINLIIRQYHYDPNIFLWRANAGGFKTAAGGWVQGNIAGCPDIIGFIKPTGRFVGIECKVGKNTQQTTQVEFQKKCNDFNAIYILAYSLEEVEQKLKLVAERCHE